MIAFLRRYVVSALLHEAIRRIRPMPPLSRLELDVLRAVHGTGRASFTGPEYTLALVALDARGLIRVGRWHGPVVTTAGRTLLEVLP